MAELKLTDLISVKTLQDIQDGFANLTGMAALTTDADGTPVTRGSNFTEFCMDLTRKNSEGCRRCEKCDKEGGEKTYATGNAVSYDCHAGLVDFAAPIMLNGKMIGSFIGGQVLTEEPDEDKFRAIAAELGINEDRYVEAVHKVKVVDKKAVAAAANFLCKIASVLSESAYDAYLSSENSVRLKEVNQKMNEKISAAEDTIKSIEERLSSFASAFDSLSGIASGASDEVTGTFDTLKQLQNIALNTKILGFNASVEASRAREAGKGFGIIAQEVRSLAETSKASSDSIQESMNHIKDFTADINENIEKTKTYVERCMSDLEQFSSLLDEIKQLSM